jgi:hypothetical protein
MSDGVTFVLWTLWIVVLVSVGTIGVTNNIWKSDTVERGLAMYCPDNGQWAWNGECFE